MGTQHQKNRERVRRDVTPFWRSRWMATALLSVISAVVITCLLSQMQAFTILDGGRRFTISARTTDVTEAMRLAGVTVGEHDAVRCTGNEITIDRAFAVTVTVNGETKEVYLTGGTVGDALAEAGVNTDEYCLVNAMMSDTLDEGTDICLESVLKYAEREDREELPFETVVQYTPDLPKGVSRVTQKGQNGEVVRQIRDTVVDGEVISSVVLSERRTEPVTEIRLVGTTVGMAMSKPPYEIELDELGQPIGYKSLTVGQCTAYTNDRGLCGKYTSTGRVAAVGVVAVDPRVIPYGTELYIVSADGSVVYGYAIAGDTGGALTSGRVLVDLFMDTYEDCMQFGRRNMNVYILS